MNAAQRRQFRRAIERDRKDRTIKITRSFSYKQQMENIGGPRYESADFFMSAQTYSEPALAEQTATMLHAFCKKMVLADRNGFAQNFRTEFGSTQATTTATPADKIHPAAKVNAQQFENYQKNAALRGTDKLPPHLRPAHDLPENLKERT